MRSIVAGFILVATASAAQASVILTNVTHSVYVPNGLPPVFASPFRFAWQEEYGLYGDRVIEGYTPVDAPRLFESVWTSPASAPATGESAPRLWEQFQREVPISQTVIANHIAAQENAGVTFVMGPSQVGAVPEPSTTAMLLLGALGLNWLVRRARV
jgi:PEP-CTERM motif-containing protein